jgi:signal transduction histidine kinase
MDRPPRTLDVEEALALAHALRTPLTSLALGLGLLDDGVLGPLSEAQREIVHTLVGDVARLTHELDRRLDTGFLGPYTGPVALVRVDLGALVRRAAVPIERQAEGRGVAVCLSLAEGVHVVADPVKLGWVAVSLMGNALRYSPPGGAIDVDLSAPGQMAELRVSDRGPGLDPGVRDRLFDREGGPGLFLAREIVEDHGGHITVASAPGQGSTFTISLKVHGGEERT